MSKCEFVYETDPVDMRLTGGVGGLATLRCKTHDCSMVLRMSSGDITACLVGHLEALEERIIKLEKLRGLDHPLFTTKAD
jgi:hypothetical protein